MGLILTPGAKKLLLTKLIELTHHVHNDAEREIIMSRAAEIMPALVSEQHYYEPELRWYLGRVEKLAKARNTKKRR